MVECECRRWWWCLASNFLKLKGSGRKAHRRHPVLRLAQEACDYVFKALSWRVLPPRSNASYFLFPCSKVNSGFLHGVNPGHLLKTLQVIQISLWEAFTTFVVYLSQNRPSKWATAQTPCSVFETKSTIQGYFITFIMECNFLDEEPLPAGFITIDKIREFTSKQIQEAALLNVVGIVKDQQAPMLTKGSGKSHQTESRTHTNRLDAKYTIEILDATVPMEKYGLKVNIFWPLHKMPKDVKCADIVVIRKIKVSIPSDCVMYSCA